MLPRTDGTTLVAVLATLHPDPIRLWGEISKVPLTRVETLMPGVRVPSATAGTPADVMRLGDMVLLTNAVREADGERHGPVWAQVALVDLKTDDGGPTSSEDWDASRDGEANRTAAEQGATEPEPPSAVVEADGPGDAALLADISP